MDTYFLFHMALLGLLILVCMFFSAVETSLLSFPRALLQRRAEQPGLIGQAFREWHEHPNQILTSILVGNNMATIAATTLVAFASVHLAEDYHWSLALTGTVSSVLVTIVIIVFGEAIPKVVGRAQSVTMATWLVVPIYFLDRLLRPVTWALVTFVKRFMPKVGHDALSQVTEEDIKQMIEMGQEEGTIEEDEKRMIHSIFKFTDTKVASVMIPRTDMFCVDIKMDMDRLVDLMVQNGYSRVPVYEGSLDRIVGIIHTRDLLSVWKNRELIVLQDLLHKAYFVPGTMSVDRLLRQFRRGRFHMAIVVDEYGGTAGLVTLEDLVEEIVGEIHDETDAADDKAISTLADGNFAVEADVALDDVNESLGLHLIPKGEVASLGGYLMEMAGKVPKKGRVIEDREASFKILDASDTNVIKVRVVKRKTPLAPGAPLPVKPPRKRKPKQAPAAESAPAAPEGAGDKAEGEEGQVPVEPAEPK